MSEEACIVVEAEDGFAEILSQGFRVARKEHKCGECRKKIEPKSRYYYETALFEGELSHYKTCEICKELRDKLFSGWIWGELWIFIREFIRQDPSRSILDCAVGKLSPPALEAYLDAVKKHS